MAVMSRELEPGGEAHVERGRGRIGVRLEESGPFKTSRYADLLRMPLAGRGMVAVGCKEAAGKGGAKAWIGEPLGGRRVKAGEVQDTGGWLGAVKAASSTLASSAAAVEAAAREEWTRMEDEAMVRDPWRETNVATLALATRTWKTLA